MKAEEQQHGGCLCGSVRITAKPKKFDIGAYCDMCRKWGGGPLLSVECGEQVSFDGEEHIATYASSEWAERGFCKRCGSHLFYRLKQGDLYAIPLGLFDDTAPWKLSEQIFIEKKPDFYSFAEKTTNRTGAEVFAQYTDQ